MNNKQTIKIELQGRLPKYLYHKSSNCNRNSILKEGLTPRVGPSYFCHWDMKENLKPLIFLYDKDIIEYDTTYDDDIYQVEVSKLDLNLVSKDPDECMKGCYVYSSNILPNHIQLIYKGTGKSTF